MGFPNLVERPKSGGPVIRRTSSLDTLSGSYMSSQWPRGETPVGFPAAMVCKETQVLIYLFKICKIPSKLKCFNFENFKDCGFLVKYIVIEYILSIVPSWSQDKQFKYMHFSDNRKT